MTYKAKSVQREDLGLQYSQALKKALTSTHITIFG